MKHMRKLQMPLVWLLIIGMVAGVGAGLLNVL
jgi:hypothetical protein